MLGAVPEHMHEEPDASEDPETSHPAKKQRLESALSTDEIITVFKPTADIDDGSSTMQTEEESDKITPVEATSTDKQEDEKSKQSSPRYTESLLQLERDTMGPDWFEIFGAEIEKPYFLKIKKRLELDESKRITIFPPKEQIYSFTKCPLNKIKVVILGQDPYHGQGQAHGLCFSVQKGVANPPSLNNIFKELADDLGKDKFQKPKHGFLEGWATQGVLLLNSALTVQMDKANSHAEIGWARFTDAIVEYINKNSKNVCFLLWGGNAQKKGEKINKSKHLVLKSAHPSPLSAHRGFFKQKHFSKANAFLVKNGLEPVDWNHL
ncbi:hypothetical protein SmJEL517_g00512 [Synchytrium microbalum]|uniref:Uracil-DNA glycosylase n=1 Tax=Synchytrium microbalum TaxID=1806994 RepID=A0A507CEV7_9FUNG|nr:uncharacterized protein SmJEL517_g00512 [Synchytrium microbalum]TPX37719.1 hypothetical protein SmJEL517_g00512 [Synchytrium microbalum]